MFRQRTMRLACLVSALLTIAALVAVFGVTQAGHIPMAHAATNTSQFKGVNWADPRDNYANDPVVPSGL